MKIIAKMAEMGFAGEISDRAVMYLDLTTIEETVKAVVPDGKGIWRHTLISTATAMKRFPVPKNCNVCNPS